MTSRVIYIVASLILIAIGLILVVVGFTRKTVHEISWGLLVPGYVYFTLMATGASIAGSAYTIFQYRGPKGEFEKIIKLVTWFSFASVVAAWILILSEITKPLDLWKIFVGFNVTSRIAWMGLLYVLVAIFLVLELVYLIRVKSGGELRAVGILTLGLAIAILAVVFDVALASNLGQVFGSIQAVPGWYGAFLAPYFVVSAVVLGAAGSALFIAPFIWKDPELRSFTSWYYGWILLLTTLVLAFLTTWGVITAWYNPQAWITYSEIVRGAYALEFWLMEVALGIIAVAVLAYYAATRRNIAALLVASVIALVAGFTSKYTLIIAHQLKVPEALDGLVRVASYHVSGAEALILLGAVIVWPSLYLLGQQLLPLLPGEQPRKLLIFK